MPAVVGRSVQHEIHAGLGPDGDVRMLPHGAAAPRPPARSGREAPPTCGPCARLGLVRQPTGRFAPPPRAASTSLAVISPGVGALLTLRLAPDGPGAHRVVGGLPAGIAVDARVFESPGALQIDVRGGTWSSPLGALPLGATRLRLPRVGG